MFTVLAQTQSAGTTNDDVVSTAPQTSDIPESGGGAGINAPSESPALSGGGGGDVDPNSISDVANEATTRFGLVFDALKEGRLDTDSLGVLFVDLVLPALLILLVLFIAYIVAKFLSRMLSGFVGARIDETLGKFLGKVVFWSVMLFAVLGVLQKVGIGIAAFAAALAAAGFAVGLAFQGTLSSFAAGIMLLAFRPFKVGHVVNAAGVFGKVNEIDLFHTTFDTFDNRRMIVPNSEIFNNTIENVSFHAERRADVNVGVEYSADIDKTREVLNKAAESIEGVIEGEGRGHTVMLLELGASSVDWTVRIWVPAADFWAKKEELVRAVKMHLDEAGIGIPFPQMDVHIDGRIDKGDGQ